MYTETHWCTGRLSPTQNLENRRDQFAAMRHQKQRVLFLQNVHVPGIISPACLWYMITIAYCSRKMQYCPLHLAWVICNGQYFIVVAIAASAVRRKKSEMKSRSSLYCPKCPRIALRSPGGSSLFEQLNLLIRPKAR